jgi:4-carboxymuconolactone decarboxylase
MARLPAITSREGLTPAQQTAFDAIVASRGTAIGPWPMLLHRPEIAAAAEAMGGYLRYRSPLDATVREAVILTVATLLECEFERHAHEPIARKAGVDVDAIAAGRALDGDAGLAVAVARALVIDHRVSDELFARVRARWDDAALVDLISLVGYYAFLAAVLNGFEVTP